MQTNTTDKKMTNLSTSVSNDCINLVNDFLPGFEVDLRTPDTGTQVLSLVKDLTFGDHVRIPKQGQTEIRSPEMPGKR